MNSSLPLWVKGYLGMPITGTRQLPDRFWSQVQRPFKADDCWLWQGKVDRRTGSPVYDGRSARRAAFACLIHEIPNEVVVHSRCRALCVNPAHAEITTRAEAFTRFGVPN